MKTKFIPFIAFVILVTFSTVLVHAGDDTAKEKKSEPKVVTVCPVSGDDAEIKEDRSEVVGDYKVYFCCGKCAAKFSNLSDAEKLEKTKAAAAKQEGK